MTIKIGINGMGRIGRMIVRSIIESKNKNLKINHINNRSNLETTSKLIKYDSIHGKLNADLDCDLNHLIINTYILSTVLQIALNDLAIFAFRTAGHFYVVEPIIITYIIFFLSRRI